MLLFAFGTNPPLVALLTEGVDRNKLTEFAPLYDERRPPH